MSRETGYVGRANVIRRVLRQQDVDLTPEQYAAVTRVQVIFGSFCADTDSGDGVVTLADGVVEFRPGLVPGVTPGRYEARIVAWDAQAVEGYAWGSFQLRMLPWGLCPSE